MSKDWLNRKVLMKVIQTCMIALDLTLLAIPGYFSISNLPDTLFGLKGVVIKGTFVSYSYLADECEFKEYCEKIANFYKGGQALIGFICFDIIVLISVILMSLILTTLMKQVVLDKETCSNSKRRMLRVLAFNNNLLFLHPFAVNLGFLLWIIVSRFTQLSDKVVLREGVVVLIIQCFLSWLSIAYNIWIINSTRRRNMQILRGNDYKKEDLSVSI